MKTREQWISEAPDRIWADVVMGLWLGADQPDRKSPVVEYVRAARVGHAPTSVDVPAGATHMRRPEYVTAWQFDGLSDPPKWLSDKYMGSPLPDHRRGKYALAIDGEFWRWDETHLFERLFTPIPRSAATTDEPVAPRLGGIGVDWWAESIKLDRHNRKLVKALKEQHDWHLAQGEKDFGDDITLNMADEYADSAMCERTIAAPVAAPTTSPEPSPVFRATVLASERLERITAPEPSRTTATSAPVAKAEPPGWMQIWQSAKEEYYSKRKDGETEENALRAAVDTAVAMTDGDISAPPIPRNDRGSEAR